MDIDNFENIDKIQRELTYVESMISVVANNDLDEDLMNVLHAASDKIGEVKKSVKKFAPSSRARIRGI